MTNMYVCTPCRYRDSRFARLAGRQPQGGEGGGNRRLLSPPQHSAASDIGTLHARTLGGIYNFVMALCPRIDCSAQLIVGRACVQSSYCRPSCTRHSISASRARFGDRGRKPTCPTVCPSVRPSVAEQSGVECSAAASLCLAHVRIRHVTRQRDTKQPRTHGNIQRDPNKQTHTTPPPPGLSSGDRPRTHTVDSPPDRRRVGGNGI